MVTIRLSELFVSIQGEGRLAGVVSGFIRLAGCSRRCGWCDTAYAWDRDRGRDMPLDQLLDTVRGWRVDHAVVTGGEPLEAEHLEILLAELHGLGVHVTLETSGLRYRKVTCDLLSLSPKLDQAFARAAEKSSVPPIDVSVLRRYLNEYDYQLKFVVSDRQDIEKVEALLNRLPQVPRDRVMLMPQAKTRADYRRRAPLVAQWCVDMHVRFCPRLQLELWDQQRGR